MRWTILALALVGAGCSKKTPEPASEEPVEEGTAEEAPEVEPVPSAMAPDALAPFPYTAEQIRDSWVTGLVVTWQVTGEGGAMSYQRWEVGETDADGVTLHYFDADETGAPVGEADTASNTWDELRDHASFPAARTTVEMVTLETPFGEHEATLYTVQPTEEGGPVKRYWFGKDTPGAPLLHDVRAGEELLMELKMTGREVEE